MYQLWRVKLQHDRITDGGRGCYRRLDILDLFVGGYRNPVSFQNGEHLRLGQVFPLLRACLVNDGLDPRFVGAEDGDLTPALLPPLPVAVEGGQRTHRRFRVDVIGDTGLFQGGQRLSLLFAHEAGQDRFIVQFLATGDDTAGNIDRIGRNRRHEDHQNAVDIGVGVGQLNGLLITFAVGGGDHVDRVVAAAFFR